MNIFSNFIIDDLCIVSVTTLYFCDTTCLCSPFMDGSYPKDDKLLIKNTDF